MENPIHYQLGSGGPGECEGVNFNTANKLRIANKKWHVDQTLASQLR